MLILLLVLNWLHPPIEAFIDYPASVDTKPFSIKVTVNDYENINYKIIACLENICFYNGKNKTNSVNFTFVPLNKKMQLKVTIKSKYKDLVINKTIFPRIQNKKKIKKSSIKLLPIPQQKQLIYDSGKEKNKNISIALLTSICLIISMLLLWESN